MFITNPFTFMGVARLSVLFYRVRGVLGLGEPDLDTFCIANTKDGLNCQGGGVRRRVISGCFKETKIRVDEFSFFLSRRGRFLSCHFCCFLLVSATALAPTIILFGCFQHSINGCVSQISSHVFNSQLVCSGVLLA